MSFTKLWRRVYPSSRCLTPVRSSGDGIDGYVVPIRDVEALKVAMKRLFEDDELRRRMAINARKRAEEFPWSVYRTTQAERVGRLIENWRAQCR